MLEIFHLLLPYSRMIKEVQTISFTAFRLFDCLQLLACVCLGWRMERRKFSLPYGCVFRIEVDERAMAKFLSFSHPRRRHCCWCYTDEKFSDDFPIANSQGSSERWLKCRTRVKERLQQVNLRWKFNFSLAFIIFEEEVLSMSDVAMRFISRVVCCCFRRIEFWNIFISSSFAHIWRLKKTFFVVILECFSGGCRWSIETFDKSKISTRLNFHEQKYMKLNCLHLRIECFRARVDLWTFFSYFLQNFYDSFQALELSSRAKQFPFDCWNQQHAIHMVMKTQTT